MRAIVVDTTTLQRRSTELKGFQWTLVLNASRSGKFLLAVPEVCLLEANRQVQISLDHAAMEIKRAASSIRLMDVSDDLKLFCDRFQKEANAEGEKFILNAKTRIHEHGGRVLPLPDVSHSVVVQKELGFVKPFSEDGSGYRDTLIWHSLLDLVRSEPGLEELFFVTNNSSDFAVSKKNKHQLAANLVDEVKIINNELSLHLVSTLDEFIAKLDLTRPSTAEGSENARDANFNTDLANAIERAADDVLWSDFDVLLEVAEALDVHFPEWFESPKIAHMEIDFDTLTYSESEIGDSTDTVLICEVEAEIFAESPVYKGEMHSIPNEYWVSDGDMNDHYGEVQTSVHGKLQFNALASLRGSISSCTLIGLLPS